MKIGFDQNVSFDIRIRIIIRAFLFLGLMFVVIFVSAGRWDYWQGWLSFLLFIYTYLFSSILIPSDLLQERFKPGPGTKKWDYIFLSFYIPLLYMTPLIAALDGGRYHWTTVFPQWINVFAFVIVFLGYTLVTLSIWANQFFSTRVRIQKERGHFVIDKGPYAFIRHPGYTGGIISSFSIAIGLNSLWALIPAGLYSILLITRTILEDATLHKELPGYADYSSRVKYRLLPGIW